MPNITIKELRKPIQEMYSGANLFQRFLNIYRPYICPFHRLISFVPQGSKVLDIGCGAGLFLNLLTYSGKVKKAVGIDANKNVIKVALAALNTIGEKNNVVFEHRQVESGLPSLKFDVVSMIDVVHHIKPDHQQFAIKSATSRVSEKGLFLYKDISSSSLWRAWANRLHDIILARQWINYVNENDIVSWMAEEGFKLEHRETINMWWYGHELMLFRNHSKNKT